MPTNSETTITVIISIILATSAFLAVTISQPTNQIQVTAEQAISILKESGKTDHFITDQIKPESIKLEYISINWQNYLRNTGYHTSLYVSTSPVGEVKPYWIIDYNDTSTVNLGGAPIYGRYVVDSQTGEVMLSLESRGGLWITILSEHLARTTSGELVSNGTDYSLSLQPEAWDVNNPVEVKLHSSTPITLTLKAEPGYDASLPVSIKVNNIPLYYSVDPNNANAILNTGGSLSFTLSVTWVPVADFLPPPTDPHPHFNVEVSFLGTTTSYSIYVVGTYS